MRRRARIHENLPDDGSTSPISMARDSLKGEECLGTFLVRDQNRQQMARIGNLEQELSADLENLYSTTVFILKYGLIPIT